jgi:hypothetical protein
MFEFLRSPTRAACLAHVILLYLIIELLYIVLLCLYAFIYTYYCYLFIFINLPNNSTLNRENPEREHTMFGQRNKT